MRNVIVPVLSKPSAETEQVSDRLTSDDSAIFPVTWFGELSISKTAPWSANALFAIVSSRYQQGITQIQSTKRCAFGQGLSVALMMESVLD
jgi:hypothetical protein